MVDTELRPCSAITKQGECKNGFVVNAACRGIGWQGTRNPKWLQMCMNTELTGRLYNANGGRPTPPDSAEVK